MIAGNPSEPALPREITERARQLGPLESPVIWWVLAGLAIAVLAVAVWRWRSRRVRWWGLATSVVCVLLAAATAVNSYVGYVRTVDDLGRLMRLGSGPVAAMGHLLDNGQSQPDSTSSNSPSDSGSRGPVPHGHDISRSVSARIENLDIADPANAVPSGGNLVLLPPGYFDPANAERRYPVVYLFHGYPYGGPNDWLTSGDAPGNLKALETAKLISPMIVVSVDMTAGQPSRDWECLNVPGGPQLESYFADTVVPAIDRRYRTVADRSGRALGGMSGGGYGALNVGLHHVDEFGTLVIALPYDDLNDSIGVLGGDQAAIRADTPRQYIPTMHFSAPVAVMLAVGAGAPTDVDTANRIADSLRRRGQEAVVHAERGFNHTWHTARATLPYLLVFADQHFHQPGSPPTP
jgi:S-formylglutathione hydrolase FrmB